MKASELEGEMLDCCVARALGWIDYPTDSIERGELWHLDPTTAPFDETLYKEVWFPSSNWQQGGPLIYRERMEVRPCGGVNPKDGDMWQAQHWEPYSIAVGPTPLIAAMRAFVISVFGEEVADDFQ